MNSRYFTDIRNDVLDNDDFFDYYDAEDYYNEHDDQEY